MSPPTDPERNEHGLSERIENDPSSVDFDEVVEHAAGSAKARKTAADALGEFAISAPDRLESGTETLEELLIDSDREVRSAAIVAAERLAQTRPEGVESLVPALAERLDDESGSIQHTALTALANVAPAMSGAVVAAVPGLEPFLDSDIADIRDKALTVLVHASSEAPGEAVTMVSSLVDILTDGHDGADQESIEAVNGDDVRKELAQGESHARRQSERSRAKATHVLAAVANGKPEAVATTVPRLLSLLETEEVVPARVGIVTVLASVAAECPDAVRPAVSSLAAELEMGETSELRGIAALALGNIAETHPETVVASVRPQTEGLVELLDADAAHVRASTANLFSFVADVDPHVGTAAVEPLLELLTDDYPTVRGSAALALGSIGDGRSVDDLRELATSDPDEHVRQAASSAIDAIEPGQQ